MIIIEIILSVVILVFLMFVHEFIHWVTLKYFGYKSKLITTDGIWIFKGMGVKPIGVRDNIVCARHIFIVLLMPLVFGWMWFFPLMIGRFTYWDLLFGFLLWYLVSIMDIKAIVKIYKWWIKPNKVLKFG